jgi:hypothetical protein
MVGNRKQRLAACHEADRLLRETFFPSSSQCGDIMAHFANNRREMISNSKSFS